MWVFSYYYSFISLIMQYTNKNRTHKSLTHPLILLLLLQIFSPHFYFPIKFHPIRKAKGVSCEISFIASSIVTMRLNMFFFLLFVCFFVFIFLFHRKNCAKKEENKLNSIFTRPRIHHSSLSLSFLPHKLKH